MATLTQVPWAKGRFDAYTLHCDGSPESQRGWGRLLDQFGRGDPPKAAGSQAAAALGLSPAQYASLFSDSALGDAQEGQCAAFAAAMNATLRGSSVAAAVRGAVGGDAFAAMVAAGGGGGNGGSSAVALQQQLGHMNYGAGPLPFDWLSRTMA